MGFLMHASVAWASPVLGAGGSRHVVDVVVWLGVLLLLVLLGTLGIVWARRRLVSRDDGPATGLSLHDLRQLHAQGRMSDEEFEAARAAIIGAHAPKGPRPTTPRERLGGGASPESGGAGPARPKGGDSAR